MVGSLISGGLGALGSLFGGNQAAKGANQAAQVQRDIYNQNVKNETPFMDAGKNALATYQDSLGLNGRPAQQNYFDNFQTDPGFKKALDFGVNTAQNSDLARGRGYGGNTLSAIADFSGGMMQNAFSTRAGQLQGLVGTGQQAASSLAGAGQNYAYGAGNAMTQAGQFQGNALIGAANSAIGAFNNHNNLNAYNKGRAGGSQYDPGWSATNTISNRATF